MSNENKKETFEQIKFLVERSHAEASLFWIRNHVFLVVNIAVLGTAFAFVTRSDGGVNVGERAALLIFGASISLLWDLVTQRGRKMNHVWISSALNIAEKNDGMFSEDFINALKQTPKDSVNNTVIQVKGATSLVRPFICVFFAAWVAVSMFLGKGSLLSLIVL